MTLECAREKDIVNKLQQALVYLHNKGLSDYEISKKIKGKLCPHLSEQQLDEHKNKYRPQIHRMRTRADMMPSYAIGQCIFELEKDVRGD